jgi:organic radical activating enzyme
MPTYYDSILETKEKLNKVGNGFCLMKWQTETLYLHMGDNHSCYHPRPQRIGLHEIENNPSALHNTKWKKQQRKTMLEGGRPDECYYCWNIEDLKGDPISDRFIHSTNDYAIKDYDIIRKLPWDADWNPSHIELSFGNKCNFKCIYCCPQSSSSWMDEIERHGNYDLSYNQYDIEFLKDQFYKPDDYNPYINAFWKWWPDLKNDLQVLRITGGEPLINHNTYKMLDMLNDNPSPHLTIHINSNMGMATKFIRRLTTKINKLLAGNKIKAFELFTSVESWGEKAEYIRSGLDCKLWETNIKLYLNSVKNSELHLMCTYHNLCVRNSFKLLLYKILEWRLEFSDRITFDTPYIKEPPWFLLNTLPESYLHDQKDILKFMMANKKGFNEVEYEKMKRVTGVMVENPFTIEQVTNGRKDFYKFVTEHDKRRNKNFLKTFPEYKDFYELCKQEQ